MPATELVVLPPTVAAESKYTIAAGLAQARKAAELSQNQLAKRTGIGRSVLAKYEVGENVPGAKQILALCDALRITPNKLLTGTEQPFAQSPIEKLLGGGANSAAAIGATSVLLSELDSDDFRVISELAYRLYCARHGEERAGQVVQSAQRVGQALAKAPDSVAAQFDSIATTLATRNLQEQGQRPAPATKKPKRSRA